MAVKYFLPSVRFGQEGAVGHVCEATVRPLLGPAGGRCPRHRHHPRPDRQGQHEGGHGVLRGACKRVCCKAKRLDRYLAISNLPISRAGHFRFF